jgi:hypothetical protein
LITVASSLSDLGLRDARRANRNFLNRFQVWLQTLQSARQRAMENLNCIESVSPDAAVGSVPIPMSASIAAANIIGEYDPAEAADEGHSSSDDDDARGEMTPQSSSDQIMHNDSPGSGRRRWWSAHGRPAAESFPPRPNQDRRRSAQGDSRTGSPTHLDGSCSPRSSPMIVSHSAAVLAADAANTATMVALTSQVHRLSTELTTIHSEKSELEDEVANYRHILAAQEKGINFAVDGGKDQSFQIECLTQQNRFLNQELMDMRGVHTSKDAQMRELRMELETGKRALMELLQVMAEEVRSLKFFKSFLEVHPPTSCVHSQECVALSMILRHLSLTHLRPVAVLDFRPTLIVSRAVQRSSSKRHSQATLTPRRFRPTLKRRQKKTESSVVQAAHDPVQALAGSQSCGDTTSGGFPFQMTCQRRTTLCGIKTRLQRRKRCTNGRRFCNHVKGDPYQHLKSRAKQSILFGVESPTSSERRCGP